MFVDEFQEDMQKIIRTILERLNDSDSDVRKAVIELLSRLAEQGMS